MTPRGLVCWKAWHWRPIQFGDLSEACAICHIELRVCPHQSRHTAAEQVLLPGKGRGLVASRSVEAGELLMVSGAKQGVFIQFKAISDHPKSPPSRSRALFLAPADQIQHFICIVGVCAWSRVAERFGRPEALDLGDWVDCS